MVKLKGGTSRSFERCRCYEGGEQVDHGNLGDGGHVDDAINEMVKLNGGTSRSFECSRCLDGGERGDLGDLGDGEHDVVVGEGVVWSAVYGIKLI